MGTAESRNLAPPVRLKPFTPPAGLAWKLNRLRCMTPAEIGHRMVRAAAMTAERMGFVRITVPAPDLALEPHAWVHADARVDPAPYVAAADRIVAGIYDVFAMEHVELGRPPRWNKDPKTGVEAPLAFGKQLDYRDPAIVGDCKYLWEPNRHLHLVTLAQAWALTRKPVYAETLREHLDSWFQACPFRMGANWASSLEASLRLINWSFAWQLLGGLASPVFEGEEGAAFRHRWLTSVYQHAEFVNGHYSQHSSANNHLIGEAAGVFMASVAWPHWERADTWHECAREILEREALLQNAPDGVNREQATSYAQWTFDLLLLPLLAARANGDDFPREYAQRLESMLEFIASIMDVSGNVPAIGDADDGFVVRLDPRPEFCRFRSQLATGAILFDREAFKVKAHDLDDKTRWLLGAGTDEKFGAMIGHPGLLPVRRAFTEGGYYVLGCDFETKDEIRIVADAGPLGYREIAAHGHADALAFTLSVGGVEMLVDPGTFAYHTETEWRSYFRGTSAHNTIRIDGLDQSEPGGNFMWLRKAKAQASAWMAAVDQDYLEAWHDGYLHLEDPVMHRRRIVLDKRSRTLFLEDTLTMKGAHQVEMFFHCAEDARVEPIPGGVAITRNGRTVKLRCQELPGSTLTIHQGATEPVSGWVSRRFDVKHAAPTIAWRATLAGDHVIRTEIDC